MAVDIAEGSLQVARERCAEYGLEVELVSANVSEIRQVFGGRRFDLVIFLASLEHMTLEERIEVIGSTWEMLLPQGLWCLVETPNRLWYFDQHTSRLPFFHWLPDDLALLCSRHGPRESFRGRYRVLDAASRLDFTRWGRAVS
ncbi:MAG TPA: class I SAM-dependent methyltransferase [Thermoanaerobaculaceae bacterium]|nr:class I SAM-dependent methyltransferase [Thermoanaerobaculaceae bacterium]